MMIKLTYLLQDDEGFFVFLTYVESFSLILNALMYKKSYVQR
jgi:hypothetical protein